MNSNQIEQKKKKLLRTVINLNKHNNKFTWRDPSGTIVDSFDLAYTRVFNGDLRHGGRFYNELTNKKNRTKPGERHPTQGRLFYTIDEKPLVECDYRSIQPGILYAKEHLPIPDDCYSLGAEMDMRFNRDLRKCVLLILLNAKSTEEIPKAVNKHLTQEYALARKARPQIPTSDIEEIVLAFYKVHEPIKKYFHTEKIALKLQYLESILAEKISKWAIKNGVPIWIMHDGFLTQEQHGAKLMEQMHHIFHEDYGQEIKVTIKNSVKN